jgi:hypothetical protein
VVTNVSEAVRGRLLGRVLGTQDFFVKRHLECCNNYLTASYTASTLMQVGGGGGGGGGGHMVASEFEGGAIFLVMNVVGCVCVGR